MRFQGDGQRGGPRGNIDPAHESDPLRDRQRVSHEQWSCAACNAPIDPGLERNETFPVSLSLEGRYLFRAELTMPAATCGACGWIQVTANERALASDIADVLIAAFDSLGPYYQW